ncbi:MAG: patatin-like phospholipase family protein [Gemmatimonadota bacterium]
MLAAGLIAAPARAQEAPPRPTIGLALGGGGARGMAHVGVLRYLEAERIPVDFLAGTSMGAIIGGLYAAGLSPDAIEAVLAGAAWDDILSDKAPRRRLDYRRREDGRRYTLQLEMGLSGEGVELPRGLIAGQQLEMQLRRHTLPAAALDRFDDLPIPFRAVATDLERAHTVVLDRGDLARALRASMSIPAAFAPVEIEGRLLVDGGMTENLPVDIARAMGADVVIAVDVSEPLVGAENLTSFLDVSRQSLRILARSNTDAQRARADVVLTPNLPHVGLEDFGPPAPLVAGGLAAAREQAAALRRYALTPAAYAAWRATHRRPPPHPGRIAGVEYLAPAWLDDRVLPAHTRTRAGDVLDPSPLERDVERIYGQGEFERADYTIQITQGAPRVVFRAEEKPWGPTYLHGGLRLVAGFGGGDFRTGVASVTGRVNLTRRRLTARGGEWRTDLEFGQTRGLFSEWYQPLDVAGRWFLAPQAWGEWTEQALFTDGRPTAEYDVRRVVAGLDLGRQFGQAVELRLGVRRGRVKGRVGPGAADLPDRNDDLGGFRIAAALDRLDAVNFPHRGVLLESELVLSRTALGAARPYERLLARAAGYATRERHTLFLALHGGSSLGSALPVDEEFRLGGLLSLSGYGEGALRGADVAAARAGYYYRLVQLPVVARGVYLGGWVEAGEAWRREESPALDDLRLTGTAALGADTVVGPVWLGYGWAEGGDSRLYVSLGASFHDTLDATR